MAGKCGHLFMEMTALIKTVSSRFFGGFPEYGMSNPFNFRWEITLIATPKGCKKGPFIHGIDANANTVSNLPLGLPVFRMTNACNFRLGISPANNPQNSVKTGAFTHGNDANAKNSLKCSKILALVIPSSGNPTGTFGKFFILCIIPLNKCPFFIICGFLAGRSHQY